MKRINNFSLIIKINFKIQRNKSTKSNSIIFKSILKKKKYNKIEESKNININKNIKLINKNSKKQIKTSKDIKLLLNEIIAPSEDIPQTTNLNSKIIKLSKIENKGKTKLKNKLEKKRIKE